MYVAPDSDVRFLTGVKLDPEHVNTIWWTNLTNQTNYFVGKTKYSLTNQTYQRVTKGIMRVGRPVADLYDCNYMMFRNSGFHNKWFYAFVDNVEYINNAVTEVRFTIDPIQTWYFEYNFNHSAYVERQHAVNDTIGSNILPEPVEVGEYVSNNDGIGDYARCFNMTSYAIIVAICDTSGNAVSGKIYDSVYGGASLRAFGANDVQGVNDYLASFIQKPDAVLSVYMIPWTFLGVSNIPLGGVDIGSGTTGDDIDYSADQLTTDARLDGYKPRNNKLYTYPYNFWQIDNSEGSTLTLRYEWFKDLTPNLLFKSTITNPISVVGKPNNYSNIEDKTLANFLSIEMTNFPMCSWNTDAYKAWLAQNSIPLAISGVSYFANVATGVYFAKDYNPGTAISGGIGLVSQILQQGYKASISADISRGQINNGGVNIGMNKKNFYSGRFSIQHNVARELDDFFDLYGYAYNGIAVPNINSRPEWNYVKTVGMTGEGSLPSDDSKAIDSYFNKGIRFWNWGDHIGDYSLNNRPT